MLFLQLRKDPTVGTKFTRTHFPTITIHISLNMFHWRLETKYVRAYVEYGINNQGNADTRNTEY